MPMRWGIGGLARLAFGLCLSLMAPGGPARATPLDAAQCQDLDRQRLELEAGGIKDDMAQGPGWAKLTLSTSRLEQIKLYLQLVESTQFRCPSLRVAKPADETADAADTATGDAGGAEKPKKKSGTGEPAKK